jgi:DNA polymerase III subunit gamma/tau
MGSEAGVAEAEGAGWKKGFSAIGKRPLGINDLLMSYTVFARKYRPQTFDDVVGQEHITRTLENAIEKERLAHAYIFVGPRGTGKTSTARILAKSLNCQTFSKPTVKPCGTCDSCREIAAGTSLDVLEFDAASNTQVDKVRELIIDNVRYAPTRGRFKVYIVDEVHMLSASSFNALLKTLEEPPGHVKFFFATTDVQKVPTTILSRCQRFDLKRILPGLISGHLLAIANKEHIALAPEAAAAIARGAEGGMRDAESMLDQLVAFCGEKIEEADVLTVFGLTAQQTVSDLCAALIAGDAPGALGLVHEQAEAGRDLSRLLADLISHLRNLLVVQADPAALDDEFSAEDVARLVEQAGQLKMDKLLELIEQFAGSEQRMKWSPNKKMHFEVSVIRAIQTLGQATLTEVLEALSALRGGGEPSPPGEPRPAAPKPKIVPRAAPPRAPVARPPGAETRKTTVAETPETPEMVERVQTPPPASVSPAVAEPVAASAPLPNPAPIPSAPVANAAPPPALDEIWQRLREGVRQRRPFISSWVESGVLLSVKDEVAVIGFPASQAIPAEYCQQPANRKLLETLLSEIAGRAISLRCETREGLEVTPPPAPEPEAPRDPMEEFKNDPLIRRALEIFRAEIQPA